MTTKSKPRVIKYFERVGDVTTRVNPRSLHAAGDGIGYMLCYRACDELLASKSRSATAELDGRVVEARWVVENPWD